VQDGTATVREDTATALESPSDLGRPWSIQTVFTQICNQDASVCYIV